jgi:cystatin-C
MRKGLTVLTLILAAVVAFGYGRAGSAQTRPTLGGYKTVSTDDAEVKAAAEFAVSERAEKEGVSLTLVSIESAERQVVAGTNYRLCLKVSADGEEDDSGDTQGVKVVVFRSLQKEYVLKSWEVDDCGGEQ